jgi:hypothetical protein
METLGFELLSRFVWGWFLLLSFVSRKESSEKFLRISFYVIFGVAVSMAILVWAKSPHSEVSGDWLYLECLLAVVGHALYSFTIGRLGRITGWSLVLVSPFVTGRFESLGEIINYMLSAGVLGGAFMGQFLGHWYLNVPGLRIFELQKITWAFLGAVALKSIENIVTLVINKTQTSPSFGFIDAMGRPLGLDVSQTRNLIELNLDHSVLGLRGELWMGLGTFGVIVYSMRVLWGLLAPLILGVLVKKTVDMRSTQSATGILYAICVLVLLGEGAAIFMFLNLGWLI